MNSSSHRTVLADAVEGFIYQNFHDTGKVEDMHIRGAVAGENNVGIRIRTTGTSYQRERNKNDQQTLCEKYGFSNLYLELYEQRHLLGSVDALRQEPGKSTR